MHRYIPANMILRLARLALGGALLATRGLRRRHRRPRLDREEQRQRQGCCSTRPAISNPRGASSTGIAGFDDKVADLGPKINERFDAAVAAGARRARQNACSPRPTRSCAQDLEILIQSANDTLETRRLNRKHLAAFIDVSQLVFFGESSLLQDQVGADRRPAAARPACGKYTGLEPGTTPVTQLAKDRYNEAAADPARLGSFKDRNPAGARQHPAPSPPASAASTPNTALDKLDGAGRRARRAGQAAQGIQRVGPRPTVLPRGRHGLPPARRALRRQPQETSASTSRRRKLMQKAADFLCRDPQRDAGPRPARRQGKTASPSPTTARS